MKAELDEARSHITKLEAELRQAIDDALQWRRRHVEAEDMLAQEKREKEDLKVELTYLRNGAKSSGTDAVALPPRRKRGQNKIQAAAAALLPVTKTEPETEPHPLGCGSCSSLGKCACVEQVITMTAACGRCRSDNTCTCVDEPLATSINNSLMPDLDMKRAFASSSPISSQKRPRISVEEITPQEIDFTAMFASKPPPPPSHETVREYIDLTTARPPPGETCGFCDDSTYCACAEAAAAQARDREMENNLPPLMNEVTPPPSDSDGTYNENYKLPSLYPNHRNYQSGSNLPSLASIQQSRPQSSAAPADSCANGPGTCKQCQDDPKSGLFCRSLAAIRAANPSFQGCCGNGGPGGCCKDQSSSSEARPQAPPAPRPSNAQPVRSEVKLSCAETYKTLASHAHFDDASTEISSWLPKLATVPASSYPGRGAMDIDAASVMSVIKYFDVRFGRE